MRERRGVVKMRERVEREKKTFALSISPTPTLSPRFHGALEEHLCRTGEVVVVVVEEEDQEEEEEDETKAKKKQGKPPRFSLSLVSSTFSLSLFLSPRRHHPSPLSL